MGRPTKIDRLPPEIRERIGDLRRAGRTLDEIHGAIADALVQIGADPVPRSTLGRHLASIDELGEKMREQRAVADALMAKLGDQPDDKLFRLNIELMHGLMFRMSIAAQEGGSMVVGPEELMLLTSSIRNIASASKTDTDRVEKIERRATEKAKREAAAAVDRVAARRGLSADVKADLKAEFLGIAK